MNKNLVIVESPVKAKTISQYLGKNYIVKSSFGHIRDLPIKNNIYQNKNKKINTINKKKSCIGFQKENFLNKIGIDPYNNWKTKYIILKDKKKIISEIKTISKIANYIYLATDLDREGESIAWHLKEIIGGDQSKFRRVIFNEITKNAIKYAFKNYSSINMNKVYAQQARRFMDRIVGYMVSPLLWKKISRNLSAGRVQSVVVRIIVDKEHSIKNFSPKEYWKMYVSFKMLDNEPLVLPVTHFKNNLFIPKSHQETQLASNQIKLSSCIVENKDEKIIYIKSNPPFITSTLQQTASNILGFSVKKTMIIAQKLYENGYITYMRTDSVMVSQNAIDMVRKYIEKNYDDCYLPKIPNFFIKNNHSQESHEAIRPVNIFQCSDDLYNLSSDEKKIYKLIWSQFLASQMTESQYQLQTLTIRAHNFQLHKKIKKIFFDGWTKIIKKTDFKKSNNLFFNFSIGDKLNIQSIDYQQCFSKPPIRFNESSLIKELEKKGIGRPSTYSLIMSTIQNRGYVCLKQNKFYAKKIGEIVTKRLINSFQELMNYDFTANMESQLDQIAHDQLSWITVLDNFFCNFYQNFKESEKNPENGGMKPNFIVNTSIKCKNCQDSMVIRTAKTGVFLSCSNYSNFSKEKCKYTINLIPEYDFLNMIQSSCNDNEKNNIYKNCKICHVSTDKYLMDEKHKLHICDNYPDCNYYKIEKGFFPMQDYMGQMVKCEICHSQMCFKVGKFGKFLLCSKDNCNNTRKILNNGKINVPKIIPIPLPELICKKSDAFFVIRNGISGIFLAANTFPVSRETRTPYIEELVRFKYLLPPEILYLTSAPVQDNEGNKTILRFDKNKKVQYIGSKKNGRYTLWRAFFKNNEWTVLNE
ncbi:DNA topoisomerase 1 [Buchnera aphidicola (Eriosoma grossulariae)]|uniref:type I DNA topoisomerase n=1 Tax=Buchnera aphidicola TaxID=9 RepID=UPI003464969E